VNKYLVKLGSEMSGGRYFEAVPPVQFQDKEQLPVVVGKNKVVEKNKYLEKIATDYENKYKLTLPQRVLALGSGAAGAVAGREVGEAVARRLPGPTAKLLTMGVGTIGGAYGGLALANHAFFPREKKASLEKSAEETSVGYRTGVRAAKLIEWPLPSSPTLHRVAGTVGDSIEKGVKNVLHKSASFSPELLEKLAATALSKRVNDKTRGSRLNVESPMGNHVPSSTLNKSLNSGKVDPLTQPLSQRLADRKQAISLKNGGNSPFKEGKGKADQIHNAKALRSGGSTGVFDNHPNNFGRNNASNIESALRDSKAGHTASLKFNQSGSTSFASTAPEVKAPQSLGARIMSRLKSGAGSAAAHVRGKVSAMARTPMGKIGLGVGAVAAAGIGAKAMSGPKQEEQPYYSQGYGL